MALTGRLARAPLLRPLRRSRGVRRLVRWVRHNAPGQQLGSYQRFVLLGQQRTGSNLLRAELRTRYEIQIAGEVLSLFWRVPDQTNEQIIAQNLKRTDRRYRAVGFTAFHSDLRDDVPGILNDVDNLKVVYLRRRNWLRSYVSLKIAEKYTYWIHDQPGERPERRIAIDPDHLFEYFAQSDAWQRQAASFLAAHDVLEVWYHDLRDHLTDTTAAVAGFLGAGDPRAKKWDYELTRQNPEPLAVLVENMAEIRELLRNSEWSSFLEDSDASDHERFAHIV